MTYFDNPLYKAILADPEDDTVRLVFADWLEENDDPDYARFIRLQIAEQHLPACSEFMYDCSEAGRYGTDLQCDKCEALFNSRKECNEIGRRRWVDRRPEWAGYASVSYDGAMFSGDRLMFTVTDTSVSVFPLPVTLRFSRGLISDVIGPWSFVHSHLNRFVEHFPIRAVNVTSRVPLRRGRTSDGMERVRLRESDDASWFIAKDVDGIPWINRLLHEAWPSIPVANWVASA